MLFQKIRVYKKILNPHLPCGMEFESGRRLTHVKEDYTI